MERNRPEWLTKAKVVAKEYRKNCEELERIRKSLVYLRSQGGMRSSKGKISKPVESIVEQMMLEERIQYLEKAIAAVDYALEQVTQKPNGAITLQLFNMVYWERSRLLYGAALELEIHENTAKKYNKYLLKKIAEKMGYVNFSESVYFEC